MGAKSKENAATVVEEPHCIYFYYLTPKDSEEADVRAFIADMRHEVKENDVDDLIAGFVKEARDKIYNVLIPFGLRFADITWRRQSYVVLVVDDAKYKLSKDMVDFKYDNEIASHTMTQKKQVKVPGGEMWSGVRFLNSIAKKYGKWSSESDDEKMKLKISYTSKSSGKELKIDTHNDSGTNMGPPVPPPWEVRVGAGYPTRTDDLPLTRRLLYQLS
jgi:hypothetical protein